MVIQKNIPTELVKFNQFCLWKKEERNNKICKIPYGKNNRISIIEKENLLSFDAALKHYSENTSYSGIGFSFFKENGIIFIDIDYPFDSSQSKEILDKFKGKTYCEKSPSKKVHIFCKGIIKRSGKGTDKKIEIYDNSRYATLTGDLLSDLSEINNCQDELNWLQSKFFSDCDKTNNNHAGNINILPIIKDSDLEHLERFRQRDNKLDSLLNGHSEYASQSEADLALCQKLAFYFNKDFYLIDSIFRNSALYREKWNEKRGVETYGQITINKAINSCGNTYSINPINPINPQQRYHLTDLGNSERFSDSCRGRIVFCHDLKSWFIWNGQYWKQDNNAAINKIAKGIIRGIYNEAAGEENDNKRKELLAHAKKSESKKSITDMLYLAQSELPITQDKLDMNHWILNCVTGSIDLRTGLSRSHDSNDYLTRYLPIELGNPSQCHIWLNFLNKILNGNQELIKYIKKAIGYTLSGDTSEQCLFFLYGHGKNGKSTFIELLEALLSDYSIRTPAKTICNRSHGDIPNDIARLKGARFVVSPETEEGSRLNESLIKDLTGGDKISARFMRGEYFEFYPCFKLWIVGNHKPMIKGSDFGIWRRLRLIPFEIQISTEEQDAHLLDKLKAELNHILAWAVEGCLLWQKEGLNPPAIIEQAVNNYRDEMDIVGAFLKESTIKGENKKVKAIELYAAYKQHCIDNGEYCHAQKRFCQQLCERGFVRRRGNDGWFWHGLEIGNDFSDESTQGCGENGLKNSESFEENLNKVNRVNRSEPKNSITEAAKFSTGDIPKNGSQGFTRFTKETKFCKNCKHQEKDEKGRGLCCNADSPNLGQQKHVGCEAFADKNDLPIKEF